MRNNAESHGHSLGKMQIQKWLGIMFRN